MADRWEDELGTAQLLVVVAVAVVLICLLLCFGMLLVVRRTGQTVIELAARLQELESRSTGLADELSNIDGGLADVAAALREHRPEPSDSEQRVDG